MCLALITKSYPKPSRDVVKVWKWFSYERINKRLRLYYAFRGGRVITGKWIKATEGRICFGDINGLDSYPKGFHGSSSQRGVRKGLHYNYYVLIPVEFRRVHTKGKERGLSVLVAYEMRVPRNWRKYIK